MNTDTTYTFLQHYWWFLISLLGALLVFLLFVQGGQSLLFSLGKDEKHRRLMVNSLGRKWEFTFTTLVTFGGAFFAAFPLFYSTSFGGAYWVWMAILFCFVIQAVSYEYRSKPGNTLGKSTYDWFLFLNGLLGTILLGTAVGTFFNGAMFSVNKMNLTDLNNPVISQWHTAVHGLEAVLTIHNVILGLTVFFLSRVLALLYFMNNINDDGLISKARKSLWYNAIPFVVFFLTFTVWLLLKQGFAVDADGKVFMQDYKYLQNLLQMPVILIVFLVGVLAVLWGIISSLIKPSDKGIWFAGPGTVLTVLALFLIAGYNNTAYYPSVYDLQSSLTIYNSSSSKFTLKAMAIVSLLIPFVLAYIWYAWRSINNKKLDQAELDDTSKGLHVY